MALYRATDKGNILMTDAEEAEIRAMWANAPPPQPPKKSLEERIATLESEVVALKLK